MLTGRDLIYQKTDMAAEIRAVVALLAVAAILTIPFILIVTTGLLWLVAAQL